MSRPGKAEAIPAKVLIVDDHPIVRHGLAKLINDEPGLKVCGSAEKPSEAFDALKEESPDLILLDLSLGDDSGLDLLKKIKAEYPDLPVLVLSMHDEAYYADRVLRAGAMGYVMKQESAEQVLVGDPPGTGGQGLSERDDGLFDADTVRRRQGGRGRFAGGQSDRPRAAGAQPDRQGARHATDRRASCT